MNEELKAIALKSGKTLSDTDINCIHISFFHLLINGEPERAVELYLAE